MLADCSVFQFYLMNLCEISDRWVEQTEVMFYKPQSMSTEKKMVSVFLCYCRDRGRDRVRKQAHASARTKDSKEVGSGGGGSVYS